ncbi:prominin-1-A-like isoform X2 [Oscarella lobularis]|uniref:prominin-1-A-like isoform X2 n=1 Tax=Oscarella lobularis TaxID=121494 RepID=UPI0033143CFE
MLLPNRLPRRSYMIVLPESSIDKRVAGNLSTTISTSRTDFLNLTRRGIGRRLWQSRLRSYRVLGGLHRRRFLSHGRYANAFAFPLIGSAPFRLFPISSHGSINFELEINGERICNANALPFGCFCYEKTPAPLYDVVSTFQSSALARPPMAGLADLGRALRRAVSPGELPYDAINRQMRLWYTAGRVQLSEIVNETFDYLTPVLIASGVAIGLALLIPLVATCCASCGKRRTSSSSSSSRVRTILIVVVSSLAACGVALASLALAANQRMNGGVRTTVDGVSEALPQMRDLANTTLEEFRDVTVNDLERLLNHIRDEILAPLPSLVSTTVLQSYGDDAIELTTDVERAGLQADQLDDFLRRVNETRFKLRDRLGDRFSSSLRNLATTIQLIVESCNDTLNGTGEFTANLLSKCRRIVQSANYLIPRPSSIVADRFLRLPVVHFALVNLDEVVKFDLKRAAEQRRIYFSSDVIGTLRDDVQRAVNDVLIYDDNLFSRASSNFTHIQSNVTSFMKNHLGIPESEKKVNDTAEKYINTYETYRFVTTCLLCVGVLIASLLLVALSVVGAFYVGRERLSRSQKRAAHTCGEFLLKIYSFDLLMTSLCLIVFAGTILFGSVLGESCGRKANFTGIIDRVIDNQSNWNGYPLGRAILKNPDYPLRIHDVIDECDRDEALWIALKVEERQPLDQMLDFAEELDSKLSLVTDVRAPRVDLLDSSVLAHVRHLNESGVDDVDWDDCLDVAVDSLYDATSGNFSFLRQVMSELSTAAAESLSSLTHSRIIYLIQMQTDQLRDLVTAEKDVKSEQRRLASACETLKKFPALQRDITDALTRLTEFNAAFNAPSSDPESAPAIVRRLVDEAVETVKKTTQSYIFNTKQSVQFEIGKCKPLAEIYKSSASATCNDFLTGMDSFLAILSLLSLLLILTMFFVDQLAFCYLDPELWKTSTKFVFWKVLCYRLCSFTWFVFDWGLCIFIAGKVFGSTSSSALKISVAIFLVSSSLLLWPIFLSQFVFIARARRRKESIGLVCISLFCLGMIDKDAIVFRMQATIFFANLVAFLLQDVPFLAFALVHAKNQGYADVGTFLSIITCLLGVLSFIGNSASRGRVEVKRYFQWLKFHLNPLHWKRSFQQESERGDEEVGDQFVMEGLFHSPRRKMNRLVRSASATAISERHNGRTAKRRHSSRVRRSAARRERERPSSASSECDPEAESAVRPRSRSAERRGVRRPRRPRGDVLRRREDSHTATWGNLTTADERESMFWSDDEVGFGGARNSLVGRNVESFRLSAVDVGLHKRVQT